MTVNFDVLYQEKLLTECIERAKQIAVLKTSIDSMKIQIEDAVASNKDLVRLIQETNEKRAEEDKTVCETIDGLRSEVAVLTSESASLTAERDRLRERLNSSLNLLANEKKQVQEQLKQTVTELDEVKKQLADMQIENEVMKSKLPKKTARLKSAIKGK